ncbi:threonylcarbamoyl-AMP synthase [Oscillibacter sp. MSJ-2]|uniref:Dephospho-CoA kinase n=1 Tax=Dysosmobacter acutus TaxID=2841504 RepID=A0ABS6FBL0_9FIRM|nr:L-threonylcarbamoyladenylate synthase [Dysosmobacter acutus]MBU5627455.1 threonylcarbamoyl-AMP synthase [Dysosmobacter acutus]
METRKFDLTDIHRPQREIEEKIDAAARILTEGGLLAIPTETVYGLGANGLDGAAVRRIFEAKGRPQDNPLILHVPSSQWLPRFCEDVPPLAYVLAARFWPGPLTMILRRKSVVPDETTAGLDTVGVRCPNHMVTQAIIKAAGVPVAAPSANLSGRPSCTCAADVLEDMDGKIDGIVDGGPCQVGVESTILDLTCVPPRLLRPGGLPLEELEAVVGEIVVDKAVTGALAEGEKPKAPGMKYRHYAPKAPVTVVVGSPEKSAQVIEKHMGPASGIICFDEYAGLFAGHELQTLGSYTDKSAQAQRVFDALRAFDATSVTEIYAQCPDSRGLGLAVGNRLKKAAGFHIIDADARRIVIGITGGTGSGKSSALRALEALGGRVVDCDMVYHEMLKSCPPLRKALFQEFGNIFDSTGALDRQKLGTLVFGDSVKMDRLNQIVFRFLLPEIQVRMEEEPEALYGLDAINLIESGLGKVCDRTVAVTAPAEIRVRRIMERDSIPEEYARLRVTAQKPDSFYRDNCSCVLENTAPSSQEFEDSALQFLTKLIESIKEEKSDV